MVNRALEDLGCRGTMDVLPFAEGLQQVGVLREMCQQAQFYLRVVGREEQTARIRDNRLADETSALRTDRQVLQIRIGGREPTRGGNGLVISSMYLARSGVDLGRQGRYIG